MFRRKQQNQSKFISAVVSKLLREKKVGVLIQERKVKNLWTAMMMESNLWPSQLWKNILVKLLLMQTNLFRCTMHNIYSLLVVVSISHSVPVYPSLHRHRTFGTGI